MSDSQARTSRCIDEFAGRFDAVAEILITDGSRFDEIDAALQERLHFCQETKVRIRSIAERQIFELDEQVDIARLLIEVAPRRRAKHVEAPDSVLLAERHEPLAVQFKRVGHGCGGALASRSQGDLSDSTTRESLMLQLAKPDIRKTRITVSDVRIKKMKTRWGSCSAGPRRIWLNLELARKPASCLEYILVHE